MARCTPWRGRVIRLPAVWVCLLFAGVLAAEPAAREAWPEIPETAFARRFFRAAGWETDIASLRKTLDATAARGADPWRLTRTARVLGDPLAAAPAGRRLVQETAGAGMSLADRIARAAEWIDRPLPDLAPLSFPDGQAPLQERLAQIEVALAAAKGERDRAMSKLSAGEIADTGRQLDALFLQDGSFAGEIDPLLVRTVSRIDFVSLFQAARILAMLGEAVRGQFAEDLARGLASTGKDTIARETPAGRIVIAGPGRDTHKEEAAVLIDLGGDDLYTRMAGSGRPVFPLSLTVDCGGDDAYEDSTDGAQGAGRLGVGILIDREGNDTYLAQRWGQGSCAAGVGILRDLAGDDIYRGDDCVQGAALWGIGMLVDGGGADAYHATGFAQGCGLPGGFAMLADGGGDDRYFAKGKHPTSYGDAGFFDSCSQGCALGMRGCSLSGGIALLADRAGNDRYEAGHFAQGGGHFHGWGLLSDGAGDDVYIGTRYAQGFASHQAVGYFEDSAGNDRYLVRMTSGQGVAYDHSVVAFLEGGGDDVYDRFVGTPCLCHAGLNSFCLFADLGGDDHYRSGGGSIAGGGPGSARSEINICLLIDAGGGRDRYEQNGRPRPRQDAIHATSARGAVIDLPGTLDAADLDALIASGRRPVK